MQTEVPSMKDQKNAIPMPLILLCMGLGLLLGRIRHKWCGIRAKKN